MSRGLRIQRALARVPKRQLAAPARTRLQAGLRLTLMASLAGALPSTAPGTLRAEPAPQWLAFAATEQTQPEGDVTVTLRTPLAATAAFAQSGRELLVTLEGKLPELDLAAIQDQARGRIESIRTGYDTLLLVVAPGVSAVVEGVGEQVKIVLGAPLKQVEGAPASPPALQDARLAELQGRFRLELLRAQLATRTARLAEARARYQALRDEAPQRPEPVAGLAALDAQTGRWRRSLERYAEAATAGADAGSFAGPVAAIERDQASGGRFDAEHRQQRSGNLAGPVELDSVRASFQQRTAAAWRLGGNFDFARVDTAAVLRRHGVVEPFSGRRQRAHLLLQHDGLDGTTTAASLYGQSNDIGLGLNVRRPDDDGATTASADYRRPNWDYVEGLIEHAMRDRVSVARQQRLSADVLGRVELGLNAYRLPAEGAVARTSTLLGEIRWSPTSAIPGLIAVYAVDGEYSRWNATRVGPTGTSFKPLGVVDREVHTLTIGHAHTYGDVGAGGALTVDGYAGYGKDRYGRAGPLSSGGVTYVRGPWAVQLRASHVRALGKERSTASTVGAYLSWRLP